MAERPILFSGPMVRAILDGRKTQTRRLVQPAPTPAPGYDHATGFYRDAEYSRDRGATFCGRPIDPLRWWFADASGPRLAYRCQHGAPGDQLWVRETFAAAGQLVAYDADGWCGAVCDDGGGGRLRIPHGFVSTSHNDAIRRGDAEKLGARFGLARFGGRWRPSIHMPRVLSRITIEVTEVRVQRLQEITEDDARAEGATVEHLASDVVAARAARLGLPEGSARVAFSLLWDSINGDRATWASNPWVWALTFRRLP